MDANDKQQIRSEFLIDIGKTVKKRRARKNISQAELAEYLEVERSTISRYETGVTDMPVSNLPLISAYCKFPISDFLQTSDIELLMKALDKSIMYAYPRVEKNAIDYSVSGYFDKVSKETILREEMKEYLMQDKNEVKRETLSFMINFFPLMEKDTSGRLSRVMKEAVEYVIYDPDASQAKRLQAYVKLIKQM